MIDFVVADDDDDDDDGFAGLEEESEIVSLFSMVADLRAMVLHLLLLRVWSHELLLLLLKDAVDLVPVRRRVIVSKLETTDFHCIIL